MIDDPDLDRAHVLLDESRHTRRQSDHWLASRLLAESGPPIRIRYLAAVLGISHDKVLRDGLRGEFPIRWIPCGTRRYALVEREDAKRYVARVTAA